MKFILNLLFCSFMLGFSTSVMVPPSKLQMHSKAMILEAHEVEQLRAQMAVLREEIIESRGDARMQEIQEMSTLLPLSNEVNWALLATACMGLVVVFVATVRIRV